MEQLVTRSASLTVNALVIAGVVAATPVAAAAPAVAALDFQLTAGAMDITVDLVRHGQSSDNVSNFLGTTPPGAPLTDLGEQQAVTVGQSLYNGGDNNIAGIYASEFLRTQQTSWPLDQLLQGKSDYADIPAGPPPLLDPSQILPGLNEINAGMLEGQHGEAAEIVYLLAPMQWILGNYWAPEWGSTTNPNGMAFQDNFSSAIQTMYDNTVNGGSGKLTDVAFSHAAAISTWVMMNVKNPDFALYFKELAQGLLPNTGQVVIEGNPTDGWTLVSWNGQDVPQTPDLLTGLFVDWRNLITAPQMALWNIWEAIQGGDQADISTAVQNGFDQVSAALTQFPQAVLDTLSHASGDATGGLGAAAVDGLADLGLSF